MSSMLRGYRLSSTVMLDSDPSHRRLLYIFSALSGLIALQMMHLALDDLKLNAAMSTGLICGFIYSYNLAIRWRSISTYSVSILSVLISFYYFFKIQENIALYGNYIGVLAGILIVLLAFKAFSPDDHRFIMMFSVVFLLYSSVASFDLKYMLLLPLFLVFAGCALYIANQVDVAIKVSGTIGELRRFRFSFDMAFAKLLLKAIAGIILLSSIGYILAPHSVMRQSSLTINNSPRVEAEDNVQEGETNPISSGGIDDETSEIGLSDEFDLTGSSKLTSNPVPVLKYRSHRAGYLRAQVYDTFTGTGWEHSGKLRNYPLEEYYTGFRGDDEEASSFYVPLHDFPNPDDYADFLKDHSIRLTQNPNNIASRNHALVDYEIIRQEITLLESQPAYYFSTYQPFKLENVSLDPSGSQLNSPVQSTGSIVQSNVQSDTHPPDFTFTVYALEPRISSTELKQVFNNPPEEIGKQYTQLPWDDLPVPAAMNGMEIGDDNYRPISSALRNFASTRFAQSDTGAVGPGFSRTWDVVKAIKDYLVDPDEFAYSRSYQPFDSELEVTEAFCMPQTGTHEGYCRHFSSAMAVLCRINGIPARVVSGYAPGEFSFVDNAYIYRASNAHVWVEVYFDGYGWLLFDPSPTAINELEKGGIWQFLSSIVDFLQELFVLDPASTRETIIQSLVDMWALVRQNWKASILTATAVLLIGITVWVLSRRRGRTGPAKFVIENGVVKAYLETLTAIAELGIHRRTAETARSVFHRAEVSYPELTGQLQQFLPLYENSVFGAGQISTQAELDALEYAAEVRRFVAESKEKEKS